MKNKSSASLTRKRSKRLNQRRHSDFVSHTDPKNIEHGSCGHSGSQLDQYGPRGSSANTNLVTKFDPETIRKAITAEICGGQVYFIHNRIESIYGLVDELRQIVPEARIRVAHGQMEEHELEKPCWLSFIMRSMFWSVRRLWNPLEMDVPRANTMFIDTAHLFGLSQLYQLRADVLVAARPAPIVI